MLSSKAFVQSRRNDMLLICNTPIYSAATMGSRRGICQVAQHYHSNMERQAFDLFVCLGNRLGKTRRTTEFLNGPFKAHSTGVKETELTEGEKRVE